MNAQELAKCTGARVDRAIKYLEHISAAMAEFGIDTPVRQAMFLAQIGHESGGLRWLVELWGPTPSQSRYEGRADLGNTEEGDGFKYRGRGFIQITGKANYAEVSKALGVDFLNKPELLSEPEHAARSAAWFWTTHNLNEIADTGDFDGVSDVINRGRKTLKIGDANGYKERVSLYEDAKQVLS